MTTKAKIAGMILGVALVGAGVAGRELLGEPMGRIVAAGIAGGGMGVAAICAMRTSAVAAMTKSARVTGAIVGVVVFMLGAVGRELFAEPVGRIVAAGISFGGMAIVLACVMRRNVGAS